MAHDNTHDNISALLLSMKTFQMSFLFSMSRDKNYEFDNIADRLTDQNGIFYKK